LQDEIGYLLNPRSGRAPAYPPSAMLLRQWYALSDRTLEEAL
jgi:hypothetical protein